MTARSPSAAERRARAIVQELLDGIVHGAVEVATPDGRRRVHGRGRPLAELTVLDWAFFTSFVRGGSVGVGESYMSGQWATDDLVALIRLVVANRQQLRTVQPGTLARIVADRAAHGLRTNRRRGSRRNIAAHYDLSNELYALFLDPTMTYSAALFDSADQPLADAQRAKYERLATRARIEPDDHVLEIGCGWGGFAVYAAQEHGCRVTGITLSERQARFARERVRALDLEDRVAIEIVDYRDVSGTYDRVVSIEMLEAVGHRFLGRYFATIDRVLRPNGLAAVQVITIPEQRYATYRRRPDFIQRYVFPGGHLPSLAALTHALGRHSSLVVEDVTNIGMHYAETLRRWRTRFMQRVDEVRALGFDDRFVRMWEFYLAYCEAAFAERYIADLQLLLTRPGNRTLGGFPYAVDA